MNTHGTDRIAPSIKQLREFLGFVVAIITEIATEFFFCLSPDEAKALLQNKAALGTKIKAALTPVFAMDADPYAEQRTYWKTFYQKHPGLVVDFSLIPIPEKPSDGEWRLIFIQKGLTMNQIAEALRKLLIAHDPAWKLWQYADDLDKVVTHNIRTSAQSYAIWVRVDQESDEEFRGQSTRQADSDMLIGVTLLEHLVHRMVYLVETRQHLDHEGFTLCSGSRNSDGSVPDAHWYPGSREVFVSWRALGGSSQSGGVRRAVAA